MPYIIYYFFIIIYDFCSEQLRDNKNLFKNRSFILIKWEVGGGSLVIFSMFFSPYKKSENKLPNIEVNRISPEQSSSHF